MQCAFFPMRIACFEPTRSIPMSICKIKCSSRNTVINIFVFFNGCEIFIIRVFVYTASKNVCSFHVYVFSQIIYVQIIVTL